MAVTITIDNLDDGQEIYTPYEVTGRAVSDAGNIAVVSWQIDEQDLHELLNDPQAADVTFEFSISSNDCPVPDCWYMLTVLVWDAAGVLTTACRTFKRLDVPIVADPTGLTPHG